MIDRTRALCAATLLSAIVLAAAGTAAAGDTDHVVTFINKCKQQVWIGEHGNPAIEPHEWALAPTCTKSFASSGPIRLGSSWPMRAARK